MRLIENLTNWVFPHSCLLCKNLTKTQITICKLCLKQLPWADITYLQQGNLHLKIIPLFEYEQPITSFISDFKFNKKLYYANLFGHLFSEKMIPAMQTPLPQYLIPVPLHYQRLRSRGFNQALEFARIIGKQHNLTIIKRNCIRTKNTKAQSSLPATLRKHNLKNAFSLTQPIQANHVAIIDDVVTTGQTVIELAATLSHSGITQIEVWCIAQAKYKSSVILTD